MIWKDVPDYEGLYQVSSTGLVRSLDRYVNSKGGSRALIKGRMMKLSVDADGYYGVGLTKDKHQKGFRVNRLVAEAFIPNPDNLPVVHHIDCDITNNCVENLKWVTVQENTIQAIKDGRCTFDPVKKKSASVLGVEKTRKPVRCIETNEIFYSVSDLRRRLNTQVDVFMYISTGRPLFGMHYRFLNDEDQKFAESRRSEYVQKPRSKHNSKSVRCIETGEIFESQVDAAQKLNLPVRYVVDSAKHISTNCRGISFEYV